MTTEELQIFRQDQRQAEHCGVPWQERGPAEVDGHRPQHWRGQVFRPGSDGGTQRYGNRGGKWREYYAELARSGRLVVKHKDPWHGISKGNGKGKLNGKESQNGKNMK